EEQDDYDPKMERITTILAIVAAILIGCIVLFLVGRAFGLFNFSFLGKGGEQIEEQTEESEKEQVEMIEVVGQNVDDVKVALLNLGLTPEIEYQESTQYGQGIVMESSVASGTMIEEGTNIVLTVSAGSEGVEVPDVVGMTEAEAVANLGQKGFLVNTTEGYDQYIKEGNIITQSPAAGSKAPGGTTVSIRVSLGPENAKVRVPDLTGLDESAAMASLVEAGLQLGVVSEVNNENAELTGLVCYQSYSVGSYVDEGTTVDISISLGPIQATYRFSDSISAPTPEEDPNYKSGTTVTVTLMADDGTQLLSTQTASFPIQQQNISGIKSETGYILYQYINVTDATNVTNEDGTVTTVEGTSETKEIRRPVKFIAE
ncbi:MAG: PASTA domain-containing protein, partial [Firmicutes bacterium]|nr:PASTA domain-containing protein [Bacillota bacterium]